MKNLLVGIVLIAIGAFMFWLAGPSVINDITVDKNSLQETADYQITDASCRTKFFLLGYCSIDLYSTANSSEQGMHYFIIGRLGGESVYPLVSQDGSYVTTNLGLDYVWNRLAMLVLVAGAFVLGGLLTIFKQNTNSDEDLAEQPE